MIARLASAAAAALIVGALVSGCSAPAEPAEPTPLFTSEEQAFAAAEETYRAYVDALNNVDLSDPATFEDVYAWTTGDANANDRKGLSGYHADGVSVSGDSIVVSAVGSEFAEGSVTLAVCLDVSDVEVVDSNGDSLVNDDRVDVQSLAVTLLPATTSPTALLIAAIGPREEGSECVG